MFENKTALFVGLSFLILAAVFYSCDSDVENLFHTYIEAHNAHDIDRVMSVFSQNVTVIVVEGFEKQGKRALQDMEEFDAEVNSHYSVSKIQSRDDTLVCQIEETNDIFRLAGISEIRKNVRFIIQDSLITEMKIILPRYSWNEISQSLKPFREWAQKERQEQFDQLFQGGQFAYGRESAKIYLHLLKEWNKVTGEN